MTAAADGPAIEVAHLTRRFGDCKDKASLMHALLEASGIDSRIVLLRMRRMGQLPERPASLAVFNHAILYVPEFDLWLDGTATGSGTRELSAEDRAVVEGLDGSKSGEKVAHATFIVPHIAS